MTHDRLRAAGRAALIVLCALLLGRTSASAAQPPYRLEVQQPQLTVGETAMLAVRLVDATTGRPVDGAVIFRTRLDMAPDGMADMTEPLTPIASAEPGVHRFKATPTMAGRWALSIQAKVPGEAATVTASTILTAVLPPQREPAAGKPDGHQHGH